MTVLRDQHCSWVNSGLNICTIKGKGPSWSPQMAQSYSAKFKPLSASLKNKTKTVTFTYIQWNRDFSRCHFSNLSITGTNSRSLSWVKYCNFTPPPPFLELSDFANQLSFPSASKIQDSTVVFKWPVRFELLYMTVHVTKVCHAINVLKQVGLYSWDTNKS